MSVKKYLDYTGLAAYDAKAKDYAEDVALAEATNATSAHNTNINAHSTLLAAYAKLSDLPTNISDLTDDTSTTPLARAVGDEDGLRFTTGYIKASAKGVANGVASLDGNGKVPSAQLPSYVDDVLEYANLSSFPTAGESDKIYVAKDNNKIYRWSGSGYVEISASLTLGETSSTAGRGDHTATAYAHSQSAHAPTNAQKNVQSDWNETNTSADAYIKNKPTIPTIPDILLETSGSGNSIINLSVDATNKHKLLASMGVRMDLNSAQVVTGAKTYTGNALRVRGTGSGETTVRSANTSATAFTATFPSKTGTVAFLDDIEITDAITIAEINALFD